MRAPLRITYNAPVVLTFALLALVAHPVSALMPGWFVAAPNLDSLRAVFGLVTHVFGHSGWDHLLGNLTMILLIGPVLEERHGSLVFGSMMLATAVVTGLVHAMVADDYLLGASGLAFMMVLLASTTNVREGEVPLTLLLIAMIFLGREVVGAFRDDHVSQLAHLVGGAVGAVFGLLDAKTTRKSRLPAPRPPAGHA